MNKIKLTIFSLVLSLSGLGIIGLTTANALTPPVDPTSAAAPATPAATSAAASPATPTSPSANTARGDACAGLTQIDPSHDCNSGSSSVTNIIKAVVNILSYIIGIAAVVMILIAGLKYITSAGDSNSISSAKNTLVYALVGLVIAVLAQFLVHFVLNASTNAVNKKPAFQSGNSRTAADA